MARAIREWRITYIMIPDPAAEVLRPYGAVLPGDQGAVPATFIISRDGMVRFRYIGKGPGDRPPLRDLLNVVRGIAGAPPS